MWARSARLPIKATTWVSLGRTSCLRTLNSSTSSTGSGSSVTANKEKLQRPQQAPEDDLNLRDDVHSDPASSSPFSEFIEPRPIQSLNIRNRIEKMEKPGSVFGRYFKGGFDEDLLR